MPQMEFRENKILNSSEIGSQTHTNKFFEIFSTFFQNGVDKATRL
jgi:hypothetical protein